MSIGKENKDYISELELTNQQLENKISELQNTISYYKNLVTTKGIKPLENDEEFKFIKDEDFGFYELNSLIKRDPKMVKMTMIDQLWQTTGNNSESRK